MNQFSLLPILFLLQCIFWWRLCRHAGVTAVVTTSPIAVFLLWSLATSLFAVNGAYDSEAFLLLLPGLWMPGLPVIIAGGLLMTVPGLRAELRRIAEATPLHWFVGFQGLRITALGTLILTLQGRFPEYLEIAIGLPDLAFGISAVVLYQRAKQQKISNDALMLWHIVGVLVVITAGNIGIQRGLPGPLQAFHEQPTAEVMFDMWLVWGPTLVVPLFLLFNALGAYAAIVQSKSEAN